MGAVTVFAAITHPILEFIDREAVSDLIRGRERYERQIKEKQVELPTLTAAPYTASIDLDVLETMVFFGKFDIIAPDVEAQDPTSDHIKTFITGRVAAPLEGFDSKVIENALKGIRVPTRIPNPEAHILSYANEFFQRLKRVGYGEFRTQNPKKTLSAIVANVLMTKRSTTLMNT